MNVVFLHIFSPSGLEMNEVIHLVTNDDLH